MIDDHRNAHDIPRDAQHPQKVFVRRRRIAVPHIEIPVVAAAPPQLSAERRKLIGNMRIVVEVFEGVFAVFVKQFRHGGVFAVAEVILVREKEPLHHAAHHHPVREDRDSLSVVPPRGLAHRLQKPPRVVVETLAVFHVPVARTARKGVMPHRIGMLQPAERVVLPVAAEQLAKAAVLVQRQVFGQVHRAGCAAGAAEVAGVDRVDLHVLEALRQRGDLASAVGRDHRVIVPLQAAKDVALRLGVTDEVERRHRMTTFLPMSDFIFSAAASA